MGTEESEMRDEKSANENNCGADGNVTKSSRVDLKEEKPKYSKKVEDHKVWILGEYNSDRPTRERKPVQRYSDPVTPSKAFSIHKGRGTQLKDIPNVAFKLSMVKAYDNLQMFHTLLFGTKAKIQSLKRNIGQFSGYVWGEDEEKQREKVKVKLDKCVKEKLIYFCDLLDIPIINKSVVKKEELCTNLLEFLESPHPTTDVLLAEKEKVMKSKRELSTSSLAKKQKQASPSGKKRKQPSKTESDVTDEMEDTSNTEEDSDEDSGKKVSTDKETESEESESETDNEESKSETDNEESKSETDNEESKSETDSEEAKTEEVKDEPKEQVFTPKTSSKKKVMPKSGGKSRIPAKSKSSEKTVAKSSSDTKRASTAGKSASSASKSKEPASKKQRVEKENAKDKAISSSDKSKSKKKSRKSPAKDSAKGKAKTSRKAKVEPTREEIKGGIKDILKDADLDSATFSDIFKQLGDHFDVDLMHRKSEIKEIMLKLIDDMTGEEDEEAEKSGSSDANTDEDGTDKDD